MATTEPIRIPIEAELDQFKKDISNLSNEVDKQLSKTSRSEKRNPQLMAMNDQLRKNRDSAVALVKELEELGKHQYVVNPEYKELATSLDGAQKNVQKYRLESEKVGNTLDGLKQKATELRNVLEKGITDKGLELKVPTDEYNDLKDSIVFMKEQLKLATAEQEKAQKAFDTSSAVKHYQDFEKELKDLYEFYNKLLEKQGHLTEEQASAFEAQEKGIKLLQKEYAPAYNEMANNLARANEAVEAASDGLNESKEELQDLVANGEAFTDTLTEAGQSIQTNLEGVENKIESQAQKQDAVNEKLEEEEEHLDNIKQKMSEIENANKVTVDVRDTDEWKKKAAQYEASERKTGQIVIKEQQAMGASKEWGRVIQRFVTSALAMALSYLLKIKSTINQGIINVFKNIGKTILNNVLGALKQIPTVVSNIKQGMNQLAGIISSKVGSAVVGLLGKFKALFSAIGSGIMGIARGFGGKLSSLFSSFTSSISSAFDFSGTIQDLAEDYTGNIIDARDAAQKQLDDYVAKVSEKQIDLNLNPKVASNIDMLKNKVKSLDAQLQQTDSTMQKFGSKSAMNTMQGLIGQINNLKASLQQLRYAWAAAVAPIVSIVIPYLQMFVNWLLKVVNAIAQLIGALTGHATYLTAVKQGVGGVTGGTKKDTKATKDNTKAKKDNNKELNKQLSGLDDLNVLTSDQNDLLDDNTDLLDDLDDLGGGGGGIGGLGDMFKEMPIEDKFKEWAEKLREMWEKGDFTELGALAGQKLKELLDSIPWDKIQDFADRLGRSIATFLNGFLEVQGLAESVGRTIGELVNTLQIFFTGFVDKFHWESLGKFIGNALMEAFRTIDWPAIGHVFAAGLNGIFSVFDAFLKAFDPKLVSDSISSMINRAFKDFNWSYNGTIVSKFFKKLFNVIRKTIQKTHFEKLGEGITAFLTHFDWSGVLSEFSQGINDIFDALQRFMDGFDGVKIVTKIAKAINDAFANFHWAKNGATIGNFLYGLVDTITSFVEQIDFVQIINGITEALKRLRWQDIADRLIEFIKNLKLGDIAKTLSDKIKNDIKWEKIGETFAKKWNTIFDKVKEFAVNFDGKGILEKIATAINKAVADFDWESNGQALGDFIKGAIDAITNFLQKIDKDKLIQGIKTFIENMDWEGIVDSFDALLDEIELWLDKIEENIDWDKVDQLASRVIDRVVEFLCHAVKLVKLDKLKNTIKSVIVAKLKLNWPEILQKLLGGVVILNLLTNLGKKAGGSFISGLFSKLGGTALAQGIATPFKQVASNSLVSGAASGLGTAIGGVLLGALLGVVAGGLAIGLADILAKNVGYEGGLREVKDVIQSEVDDITKQIKNGAIPATEEMQKKARLNNYGDSAGAGAQMQKFHEEILETHKDLGALNTALEENNVKVRGNGLAWRDNTSSLTQINEGLSILETNGNDVNGMLSILADKYGEVDNATYKFFDHLRDGDDAYVAVQNAMRESGTLATYTADTVKASNDKMLYSNQTLEDFYYNQGQDAVNKYYDSLVTTVDTAAEKISNTSERLGINLDKVPSSVAEAIRKADEEAALKSQSLEANLDRLPTSVAQAIERANQEAQTKSQALADNLDRLPTSVKAAIERANQEADVASQSLANNLDRLPTSVREKILAMDSEFNTANMPNAQAFPNAIVEDLKIPAEQVMANGNEAVTALDSTLTTANMPNAQAFPTTVVEDLKIPSEQVVASGNETISALDSTFTTENMPNAKSLGTNISDGLKNGLVSGLATIVGAITPGLQGIITAVQNIFQVHSPSVVMQNIGMNIMQGLVNGFNQGIPSMMSAVTNFGNQLVSRFNAVKSQVMNVVSSMVSNVRSAISSLMSAVSSAISNISSSMSNLGSQISNYANNAYRSVSSRVTIPRHATGQVIPPSMSEYLAILGDNNKETEVVSPLSTMKQAMIEALAETGFSGFGGGSSGDIVIQLNGREIFRAMQTENDQYKKQTGQSAFA